MSTRRRFPHNMKKKGGRYTPPSTTLERLSRALGTEIKSTADIPNGTPYALLRRVARKWDMG